MYLKKPKKNVAKKILETKDSLYLFICLKHFQNEIYFNDIKGCVLFLCKF